MFYLALVLKDIVHALDHCPFPEQDLVVDMHQGVFHVLFDLGHQVYAVHEELFEQIFSDIPPVGKNLPEYLSMETFVLKGLSVIYIALGDKEVYDLPAFIDHHM